MSDAAFIPTSGGKDASVMRARDVRFELKGLVDPRVSAVLEKLAEINHVNTKAIAELATMFNQMVDTMQSFAQVAENMKGEAQQLKQMRPLSADVDDDVSTN